MHHFKKLTVWQKSIELVADIYKLLANFPVEELYGLSSQMKRCANSIPSNISEGSGRNSKKEFKYFLSISKGSLNELQTQLIISEKLTLIKNQDLIKLEEKIDEIGRMLTGLRKSLDSK
jgi:four helix bundle protein